MIPLTFGPVVDDEVVEHKTPCGHCGVRIIEVLYPWGYEWFHQPFVEGQTYVHCRNTRAEP